MGKAKEDYAVGYGKPPKHTRFKEGRSGNPRGRAKGVKDLKTDLEEELREVVRVRESGKPKTISKQRAILKSLTTKAIGGDARAANVILTMVDRLLHDVPEQSDGEDLTAADKAILERFEVDLLHSIKHKGEGVENAQFKETCRSS